jgi:hypothetical protein
MNYQDDTSKHGTSGQPSLNLIYAFAPVYWRLLTAGVVQLCIDYDGKDGTGTVSCEARNAFEKVVTSQVNNELAGDVVMVVLMLVEHRYPKWTLGAGAYGRIEWNLTRQDLVHAHNERTVSVTTTEHRGF